MNFKRGLRIYLCEQCGNSIESRWNDADAVIVFGKCFNFCSKLCQNYWMSVHKRTFSAPPRITSWQYRYDTEK